MYSSSVSTGARFELTANAQHIPGSGSGNPYLRVTSEPSNLVFPLSPTSTETPQYCNPNSCDFGWMRDVDQVSRIMRFQVGQASGQQSLLLKVDASNRGGAPWVYVTDITLTVGGGGKSLSVVASPQTIEANKPSTVTVIVSGLSQGDTGTVALSGPGVSQTLTATGPNPIQTQITPTDQGTITVTATAPSYQPGTAYVTVTKPRVLNPSVSPQTIQAGEQTAVVITVNGLSSGDTATVTLSGPGVSQTLTATGPTIQATISPRQEGAITISASAPNYQAGTTSITVLPGSILGLPSSTLIAIVVIAALVVIGILAVFLLTRKKPTPSPGYKPYYPTAPAAPMLKPGAPQAVKPAAHRPMVIARREEEKK